MQRPVRESNPSRLIDNQVAIPGSVTGLIFETSEVLETSEVFSEQER